ncbi:MAG: hypothetical protein J5906_07630 [Acidaminococcaceae bacterium]|nr:hypothetical protein [Acidaminococcaceae bacterium]
MDELRLHTAGSTAGNGRFATMDNEELEELLFAAAKEIFRREEEMIHDLRELADRARAEYHITEQQNKAQAESRFIEYTKALDQANQCQDQHYDRWYRADGIYADVFNAATGSYGRARAMKYLGNEKG